MIITNDEDKLRTPCVDVEPHEVEEIVRYLEQELKKSEDLGSPGIGLAAPQIGIFKKAAIIRLGDYKINLINCKISEQFQPFQFAEEGCLSFPGKNITTHRYKEIYVTDNLVEPKSFYASELLAVAIQHELDHVNGVLMFERQVKPLLRGAKVGPNDPCPCGKKNSAGQVVKFKKCCRD